MEVRNSLAPFCKYEEGSALAQRNDSSRHQHTARVRFSTYFLHRTLKSTLFYCKRCSRRISYRLSRHFILNIRENNSTSRRDWRLQNENKLYKYVRVQERKSRCIKNLIACSTNTEVTFFQQSTIKRVGTVLRWEKSHFLSVRLASTCVPFPFPLSDSWTK